MDMSKKDWILLLLRESPLDRIHIMKALFLIWIRSGRKIPDYFEFVPYLYGPCSFEVYSTLRDMERYRLIVQPPHSAPKWVNYYLTEKGREEAEESFRKISPDTCKIVQAVVEEVSKLNFYELLQEVYAEAPDFAVNSIFKGVVKI